jgi:ribose 5-phosphate isomerase RpiB
VKIAVINEMSAWQKNKVIVDALEKLGHEVLNVGMSEEYNEVQLTYIHTGFIAGTVLNLGLADMVIGGCGTGQGFLISSMQFPGVFSGLLLEPVDAFLFSQINAGNCVSLALNKGYGWAGELNLANIFEKLLENKPGLGYPPERSESQCNSRRLLKIMSTAAHKRFEDIVASMDAEVIETALQHPPFRALITSADYGVFTKYL